MLVKQLLNLESTDDIETVVVEMTPEELARARATGATVVELNVPRG